MTRGRSKRVSASRLHAKQKNHLLKALTLITLFCLLVQTVGSPIAQMVSAQGTLSLTLSGSVVNEEETLVATLGDFRDVADDSLSFTVPEGLIITGIVEGQANIKEVSNDNQTLQFNWTENGSHEVKVQVQAQKAGNYQPTFTSSDSSTTAAVTVLAPETEVVVDVDGQESVETEATTEESSDDEEGDSTTVQEEEAASIEDDSATVEEEGTASSGSEEGITNYATERLYHLDVLYKVNFTYILDEDGVQTELPVKNVSFTNFTVTADGTSVPMSGPTEDPNRHDQEYTSINRNMNLSIDTNIVVTGTLNYTVTFDDGDQTFSQPFTYTWDHINHCGGFGSSKGIDVEISTEEMQEIVNKGKVQITKNASATDGTLLDGTFGFVLKNSEGTQVGETISITTSNGTGSATVEGLSPGTYTVEEVSCPDSISGYVWDSVTSNPSNGQVVINKGETASITFDNSYKEPVGSIQITKNASATDGTLLDGTFEFLLKDSEGTQVGETISITTSNGTGSATVEGLSPGTYTVEEVSHTDTISGYVWDSVTSDPSNGQITVDSGKIASITFNNSYRVAVGSVKITKKDGSGNLLKGAEFTLTDENGTEFDPKTTGEDGVVEFTGLSYGVKYTVTETKAPEGYVLDTNNAREFTITTDGQVVEYDYTNEAITGSVKITKKDDSGNLLAGAEFALTDEKGTEFDPKTTGEDGVVEFTGLSYGVEYTVTETKAPEGYVLNKDNTNKFTITENGQVVEYTYTNKAIKGSVQVLKTDESEGPLAGAEFTLTQGDEVIGKATTNDEGIAEFTGLSYGVEYTVTETKAPEGYVLDEANTNKFTITEDGQIVKFTFTNSAIKGSVKVLKTDESEKPLAGAEFTLTQGEEVIGKATTNDEGIVTFTGLSYGVEYTVTETKAPEGYVLNGANTNKFTITEDGQVVDYTYTNKAIKGSVKVLKTDESEKPLAGAEFTLTQGDEVIGTATTNDEGIAEFTGLSYGVEYTVTETKAPEGYVLNEANTNKFTIIEDGQVVDYTYTNKAIKGSVKVLKTDESEKPLAGAEFTLTQGDEVIGKATTNDEGIAEFTGLSYGVEYTVTETKAPEGYVLNEANTNKFTITEDGQVVDYTYTNKAIKGSVKVLKTDESEGPLAGAEFTLTQGDEVIGTATTNDEGIAEFTGLSYGVEYTVTETKAPEGYVLNEANTNKFTITEDGQVVDYTYTNKAIKGSVKVLKTDESEKPLAGAEFTLTQGDEVIGTATTNDEGIAEFTGLSYGVEYTVTETKAPEGYVLNEANTNKFTITEDGQVVDYTYTNKAIKGSVKVLKTDESEKPLAGAEFTLTQGDEVIGTATTNDEGIAEFTGLSYGVEYTVTETKAPEGYVLNEANTNKFTITEDGQVVDYTYTNKAIKGSVKVLKTDESEKPLAGAEFTLTQGDEVIGTATTNDEGIAEFTGLSYGVEYTVTETKAPEGYVLNEANTNKFTITEDGQVVDYTYTNKAIKGSVKVLKTDESEKPLAGAEFTLTQGDEVIGTATTNDEGIAEFTGLSYGVEYTVTETKAPEGYVLNEANTNKFTIKEDGQVVEYAYTNKAIKGSVQVLKTDENENPLAGAEFTLTQGEETIGTATTNDEGIVKFDGLSYGVEYTVTETKAPEGYVLNEANTNKFTIKEDGQVVEYAYTNKGIKGSVQVLKTDESENPLAGAEFTLTQGEETIGIATTNEKGIVEFTGLSYGVEYTVTETKAPEGYVLNKENTDTFTITEDGQVVKYDYTNKAIKGSVQVVKQDENGNPLAGAEFTLTQGEETIGTATTNDEGIVTFDGLSYGVEYTVTETKAPEGYVLNKKNTDTFKITEDGQVVKYEYTNKAIKGSVQVVKQDDDGKPLAGAEFTLTQGEETIGIATTNEKGIVEFTGLSYGVEYTVTETKAPEGYVLNKKNTDTFKITEDGQVVKYEYTNKAIKGSVQVVKQDDDGKPLAGAEFTLTQGEETIGIATTNEKGIVEFTGLSYGVEYTVTETKAPEGYVLNEANTNKFTITEDGQVVVFTFTNSAIIGSVQVIKQDESGNPLAGAEFTLTQGEEIIGQATTNAEGIVTFTGLSYGVNYTVTETKAPEGYVLNKENTATFKITENGQVVKYEYTNKAIKGSVQVLKTDESENPLAGAEFTLTQGEETVGVATTDENGVVTFEDLSYGVEYTVTETKAPEGYVLNKENTDTFTITKDGQVVKYEYTNKAIKGSVQVLKTDESENPLAGAEFTLMQGEETIGTATTDENGVVTFEDLSYGVEYTVMETKAPEGYVLNEEATQTFTITEDGQVVDLSFVNIAITGSLQVTKVDTDSKEPLAGAEFTLTDAEGNVVATNTTDETGVAVFEDLAYNVEYTITETKAPEGYLLSEEATDTFTILENGQKEEFTYENTRENPSLAVTKTADKSHYLPGETVTYTINVTNDGNVDLEGITLEDVLSKNDVVADQQLTLDGYEGAFDLAIGETASFTSTFVIPENDLADTTYKNVVTATTGDTTGEDEETIIVDPTYAFTIEKTADKTEATVGDQITYTIVVTNTGNKVLTNVNVKDDMIGLDTVIDQLDVNESIQLTGKHVVTAGDIGELENIATASVEVDGKTITHDASAIVKVSAKAAAVDDETPTTIDKIVNWVQNPKTGDTTINTLLILFVFVLAGCGLYVYRRKHRG